MKTSEKWINEWSQSGALDQVNGQTDFATELIEAIQKNAYTNPPTYGEIFNIPTTFPPEITGESMVEALQDINENLQYQLDLRTQELVLMGEKWLKARKHLRTANKGAERNAIALQLAESRKDAIEERVWQWRSLSDADMRLRMGELTAQEIRNIRACLRSIIGTSKLSQHTKQ